MALSGLNHLPYGPEGECTYSRDNVDAYHVINDSRTTVLTSIELSRRPVGPFVLCDFGAADGGTSMDLLSECIDAIRRKHGDDQEIMLVYEDQPSNDFKSLINLLYGRLPGDASRMTSSPGVYVTFSATDFYRQCLPSGTLDLGVCFTSVHWLSRRLSPGKGAIFHMLSQDGRQREEVHAQARQDWNTFLVNRARELKPGGQLVVTAMALDAEGHCRRSLLTLLRTFTSCWAGMVQAGRITQEEFDQTVSGGYLRSRDEYLAPFVDETSPVHAAGLRLVSSETKVVEDRGFVKGTSGDATAEADFRSAPEDFPHVFVKSVRPWSNSIFSSALSTSRSEDERATITDEFFTAVGQEVRKAPDEYGQDSLVVRLHAVRDA